MELKYIDNLIWGGGSMNGDDAMENQRYDNKFDEYYKTQKKGIM